MPSPRGGGYAVYLDLYDPSGAPIVRALQVSALDVNSQVAVDVAADGQGNFIVLWWEEPRFDPPQDGSGWGVLARRVSSTGEFLGSPFLVPTFRQGDQFPGAVATAADGRFVIVWWSEGQDGSGAGVYAQRYTSAGQPRGREFRVNQFTEGDQELPNVAMGPDGNFVVVWESDGQDGSSEGVFARRYAASGQPLGDEFQVNTNTFAPQEHPSIAMDSEGNFVVAWVDWFSPADFPDIVARAYFADGSPATGEFRVNNYSRADEDWPEVALSDNGTLVAVWQSFAQDGDSWGVFGRRFALPFPSTCVPSERTLCLLNGRFRVEASFAIPGLEEAGQGNAEVRPLTSDTGAFSFFDADNLELLVKLVDGCSTNERFWFFAGGLTNLPVRLTVVDSWTGQIQVYATRGSGAFQPIQDTGTFAGCGAPWPAVASDAALDALAESRPRTAAGGCTPAADALCLQDGRFEVRASWRTAEGRTGPALSRSVTADTGAFWFFDDANLELLVKVLDACAANERFWVFAGGLTDVEVELTVRDTETGAEQRYRNPGGTAFTPVQDTSAFAGCR